MTDLLGRLQAVIAREGPLAVAVSGGVDSMTLAHVAHGLGAEMIHAVSPAVPVDATELVRDHARRFGWQLRVAEAGEFGDPRYLANPANRCYFCKANLYDRIAELTERRIASGANLDDLGDYRPGLLAAAERRVAHPLVAAGIDKSSVRELAAALGLADIADLPAQPCLASRIETGIAIAPRDLAFVHRVETAVRAVAPDLANVRCRVLAAGIVLEVDEPEGPRRVQIEALARAAAVAEERAFAGVRPYRRGAAFVRTAVSGP
jgi:uncharacterized protein